MATARITTDGLVLDFSHDEVVHAVEADDCQAAILALIAAALAFAGGLVGQIAALAAGAIAVTLAAHKIQFQENDKGNGVEVTIPWWPSIALGWWGVLDMNPLP